MQRLHEGLENKDFERPEGIVQCKVCKKSGKLAKAGLCDCDPRGSQVTTEYFASGTEPTEYCDTHVAITVCEASGKPAGPYCPEEEVKTSAYISGGSAGTEDGEYLLPTNLSTDTCPIHSVKDVEPVDITGDTGGDDSRPGGDDGGTDEEDEPSDSHTGLEGEDQTLIYPDEISD